MLDVAATVIGEAGYHNASMDDIADAAGVSKPVLYQHFSSKHALYLALVDQARADLEDTIRTALSSRTNKDRVWATVDGFFRFVTRSGTQFRFVFESDLAADPDVRDRLARTHHEIGSMIGAVIAAETDLDEDEASLLGVSLGGMAQESARRWRARWGDADGSEHAISEERAKELTSILCWRGVAAFPRTGTEDA